ncbi:hypothetical protein D3C87_1586020 [compost metagenome]
MQGVDADLGAERIKVRVGRHHDGLVHVRHAVGRAARVTKLLSAEFVVAGVRDTVRCAALAQFQGGQAHERLVGGADGVGAVKRAVDQRMVRRFVKHAPVIDINAVHEQVGVE